MNETLMTESGAHMANGPWLTAKRKRLRLLDAFEAKRDRNFVSNLAGHFVHAKLVSVDCKLGEKSGSLSSKRSFADSNQLDWKSHRLGLAKHRKIAFDLKNISHFFKTGRLEFDFSKCFSVEKFRAAKMLVSFSIVGVNTFRFDVESESLCCQLTASEGKVSGDVIESSVGVTKSKMAHRKYHRRM